MIQWEYRVERIDSTGSYEISPGYFPGGDPWAEGARQAEWEPINNLGKLGWEVVSANWDGDEGVAIFKRPIEET